MGFDCLFRMWKKIWATGGVCDPGWVPEGGGGPASMASSGNSNLIPVEPQMILVSRLSVCWLSSRKSWLQRYLQCKVGRRRCSGMTFFPLNDYSN